MLYSGIMAGSNHTTQGGGANHLCMPNDDQFIEYSSSLEYRKDVQNKHTLIYAAEYNGPLQGSQHHAIPCAVCYVSTRPTVLMIPAKASCPQTWTREYYGYIMAARHNHYRSTFECVDEDQESVPGSQGNQMSATLYHAEVACESALPCPEYDGRYELNCVVCTK